MRVIEKKAAEFKTNTPQSAEVNLNDVIAKERARGLEIRKATQAASLPESFAQDLIGRGVNIETARKTILEKLAERSKSKFQITVTSGSYDEKGVLGRGITEALLTRHDSKKYPMTDYGRKFAHLTLLDMARATMGRDSNTMYQSNLIERSMTSTSDFPKLLMEFSQRILRDSFQSAPHTWRQWCRTSVSNDFRPQYRIMLSDVSMMTPVNELGEYQSTYLKEGFETIQPKQFGQMIHISRTALVNDSLHAFSKIPEMVARSAENLISQEVYSLIKKNPVLKSDNKQVFHVDHNNMMGPSKIDLDNLRVVRANMRKQMSIHGQPLNLIPKYLITTPTNEVAALQIMNQGFLAGVVEAAIQQKVNPLANTMQVIIEPRLEQLLGKDAWMVVCDPSSIDTAEVTFLNGMDTVYLESQLGFSTDGISMKARLDFGVAMIEYRGMHLTQASEEKGKK